MTTPRNTKLATAEDIREFIVPIMRAWHPYDVDASDKFQALAQHLEEANAGLVKNAAQDARHAIESEPFNSGNDYATIPRVVLKILLGVVEPLITSTVDTEVK